MPRDPQNQPSIKKIIIYSVSIFVILVVLGYCGEWFGWIPQQ